MRDLTQFCGWRGGGATSCDHSEMDRSVWKIAEALSMGSRGGFVSVSVSSRLELGKRRGRSRAVVKSDREVIVSKSSWDC